MYSCPDCELKIRFPLLTPDTYVRLYSKAPHDVWESTAPRKDFDLIAAQIRGRFPNGAVILDFGCYTGDLLARLGNTYRTCGVEIGQAAAAIAASRVNGKIWPTLKDIPPNDRFDVVIGSDVVEHFANPSQIIGDLACKLREDGLLIVSTGNSRVALWDRFGANWWYCFYPEHITFFSITTFEYLAAHHGLSLEHCERFRHANQGPLRRVAAFILACAYGYFPNAYLRLARTLRRMMGRCPDLPGVPGNGATKDHLLIVMRKTGNAES